MSATLGQDRSLAALVGAALRAAGAAQREAERIQEGEARQEALEVADREWLACARLERVPGILREVPEAALAVAGRPDSTPALEAVREWARDGCRGSLLLLGGPGTGKTVAAVHALVLARAGLWERAHRLARLGLYGEDAEALRRCARETGPLVLDDLGAEPRGQVWMANLDDLIDSRTGRPTIVTTNLEVGALQQYGPRVADRLRAYRAVQCGGRSLRGRP